MERFEVGGKGECRLYATLHVDPDFESFVFPLD